MAEVERKQKTFLSHTAGSLGSTVHGVLGHMAQC